MPVDGHSVHIMIIDAIPVVKTCFHDILSILYRTKRRKKAYAPDLRIQWQS